MWDETQPWLHCKDNYFWWYEPILMIKMLVFIIKNDYLYNKTAHASVIMYMKRTIAILILISTCMCTFAQKETIMNKPFIDNRRLHWGFISRSMKFMPKKNPQCRRRLSMKGLFMIVSFCAKVHRQVDMRKSMAIVRFIYIITLAGAVLLYK